MSLLKIIFKLFVFASLTAVVVLLLQHWLATKQYVFNKDDIAKLAKQYAGECHTSLEGEAFKHIYCQTLCSNPVFSGQDSEQAFSKVVVELRKR